jgi:hypothetical protein
MSWLFVAVGLVLVVLALWYYVRTRSRTTVKSHQMVASPAIKCPPRPESDQASSVAMSSGKEVPEVDLMLEEAKLYANHGHPDTAAKIVQEVIKMDPSKSAAWSLLLSSHSSLGKTVEFEEVAREFLKSHKDSILWGRMQALGRTLDHDNPLYADNNSGATASPSDATNQHLLIGNILVEMGVLTEEVLLSWLDTYDPKKHGRLGGYLLKHKVITLEQLDQALLKQQGIAQGPAEEV